MNTRLLFPTAVLGVALIQSAVAAPAIRIGVTPGAHAEIMQQVQQVAARQGLALDVVEFEDSTRIDAALAASRIDAASFEDAPHFDSEKARHGYPLAAAATTITLPMALYSRKLTALTQLQPGASIVIPDDPEGTARALILLQNFTLLTFKDSAGLHATLADITSNRLKLKIRRVPHERLYDALKSASIVVIDSADATRAGLQPARDSIGIEDARSPYASVIAVRERDRTAPWVAQLVAAYHSNDVARFILTRYQDSVRRPW